jgi:hypothetical protein
MALPFIALIRLGFLLVAGGDPCFIKQEKILAVLIRGCRIHWAGIEGFGKLAVILEDEKILSEKG